MEGIWCCHGDSRRLDWRGWQKVVPSYSPEGRAVGGGGGGGGGGVHKCVP